jgi:hypothetical protein
MRSRIGMALGPYWGSIVHAADIIMAISALGAVGGLSALLTTATPFIRDHCRDAMKWLHERAHGRHPRDDSDICKHGCC